jgi:hypothetical protein
MREGPPRLFSLYLFSLGENEYEDSLPRKRDRLITCYSSSHQ